MEASVGEADPGDPSHTAGSAGLPRRRVILLGASNVFRALPVVVGTAARSWGCPLEIMTAAGHGRAYGLWSSVWGRRLPPILRCGLWDALAERPEMKTATLLTDIGNDLVYGVTAGQIADWVESCLQRLAPLSTRLVLTGLPLAALEALGEPRFLLLRTLLFPTSTLTLAGATRGARDLNERLEQLARRYQATLVTPESHWYGWDPIHIRPRNYQSAWSLIMSAWQTSAEHSDGLRAPALIKLLRPHERWLFCLRQRVKQPIHTWKDGSTLSLY